MCPESIRVIWHLHFLGNGWVSVSFPPSALPFPFWALYATPCQLAVGPDKMHGILSQETGMAGSRSSLLAVSSVKCALIIFSRPCQFPQATSVFLSLFIATPPHPLAMYLLE